jgi:ABC-type dipeptide/oligopeptide/nickel transport system permease subunit
MTESAARITPDVVRPPGGNRWLRKLGRFAVQKPLGLFGAVAIIMLVFLAIAPSVVARNDPNQIDATNLFKGPNTSAFFGTDQQGRDVFSRVVHGTRTSLEVGVGAVVIGIGAALIIGVSSAFFGGWFDAVVQRLVDAIMALPWLVVLMSVMQLVGPGQTSAMVVIGLLTAPGTSRVVRSAVLGVTGLPYIEATRSGGSTNLRIILRHVLPNIVPELIVLASVGIGAAILAESSLSFLGFGVVPPAPDWGYMLGIDGRRFLTKAPWLAIFPGAAIALCVFSFNVLGDALRDVLDPRLRT